MAPWPGGIRALPSSDWQADPWAALRLLRYAQQQVAGDTTAAAGWLAASVLGFATGRPSEQALELAQDLLLDCLRVIDGGPDEFSTLLLAADSACQQLGEPRLIEYVARRLFERFTARHPADLAVRIVTRLTEGLPTKDRTRVLRTLLPAA